MAPDLVAYLQEQAARPFARPDADCCFHAADWVLRRTGIDPAIDLRGTYSDLRGAVQIIRAWGGFEAMWRWNMAVCGFTVTAAPQEGDVGILRDRLGRALAGIRVRRTWAMKSRQGVLFEEGSCLVAWSLARG